MDVVQEWRRASNLGLRLEVEGLLTPTNNSFVELSLLGVDLVTALQRRELSNITPGGVLNALAARQLTD